MRVAYFSLQFNLRESYGLGRYADELYSHLQRIPNLEVVPVATWHKPPTHAKPLPEMCRNPFGQKYTLRLWQRFDFPLVEWWARNVQLVHVLEPTLLAKTRKPLILTILDILPITHPHLFPASWKPIMQRIMDEAMKRVDIFLCVSQTVAGELQNYVGCDLSERIRVIHLGVAERFFEAVDSEIAGSEGDGSETRAISGPSALETTLPANAPYFLYTGSANTRKNLARVIEAFDLIASQIPHHLMMTGATHWGFEPMLEKLQRSPHRDRIHRLGFLPDQAMRRLYQKADAYLYVSLAEGFGLTILEAMASGCPVLTSNLSSMPEVAGGAASLVDPTDVEAIAHAMRRLAQDHTYAAELAAKGRERAKEMTWQQCAQRTAQLYCEVGQPEVGR